MLFRAIPEYLRAVANLTIAPNMLWPYPGQLREPNDWRNLLSAPERFVTDYLNATVVGFVDDGETLVVFQGGDGTYILNGERFVRDESDIPTYPAYGINRPGPGYILDCIPSSEVTSLAVCTDGIEKVLEIDECGLPEALFGADRSHSMALQWRLNILRKNFPGQMGDDCTVVTLERSPAPVPTTEEVKDNADQSSHAAS
jgi:hypothetical protein